MSKVFAVTPEILEKSIEKVEYQCMGEKMMVCLLTTKNGHEVIGQSGIRNFNEEIGKNWALNDAKNNLACLLAYQVQNDLYEYLKTEGQ